MVGGAGTFIGGGGGGFFRASRFAGAFTGGGGFFRASRFAGAFIGGGGGGFFRVSRFAGAFIGAGLERSRGLGGGLPMVGGGWAARLGLPSLVTARRWAGGRSRRAPRGLGGRKMVRAPPLPVFVGGVRMTLCPGR
jgi:hypothetical protein